MRRAQSQWGFQGREAASLSFGRTRGFNPRVRYSLILLVQVWTQNGPTVCFLILLSEARLEALEKLLLAKEMLAKK
ncbi:MAG: hypothetical protein O6948_10840 [Deltaproteobacteria bacterium]|nr:hypothetical protein [Deltaproteobacteria bacterium]